MTEPYVDEPYMAEVGKALTFWSIVEHYMCLLFCYVLNSAPGAQAAFSSIHSVEDRLVMIDAIVKSRFGEDEKVLARWKEVKRGLRKGNEKRNMIAHGTVVTMHDPKKPKTRLVPFMFTGLGKVPYDPSDGMDIEQLQATMKEFGELQGTISAFATEIKKLSKPKST